MKLSPEKSLMLLWALAAPAASAQLQPAVRTLGASAMLSAPPLLQNLSRARHVVEVNLTAAPARLSLVPGSTTSAFAYNGSIPGPTLDVREGDRVIVHFRNALPEPTTVHWHGLHIPVTSDGSPYDPVPPGGTRDYVFTPARGSAGTYWYHPHPHHRTGYQVAEGLFGAVIVRAADDPLPTMPERLLILSDNRFLDGDIDLPGHDSPAGRVDRENGREGDVLFVNGRVSPTLSIRAGEVQRWRIINASAARVYRLAIPGQRLLYVGTDGGLFERPVEVDDVTVASAERVELLVRGTGAPGSSTTLQALPYDRYVPQTRPADWNRPRDLLNVRYTAEAPLRPVRLPAVLRHIPALDTGGVRVTRIISLGQGLINGRTMEMGRVDVSAPLGATEIWQIENLVGMDHPFHLHGFQFQVLDRNGVPEPFRAWKDTVNVRRHEIVRFIVRYDDFPGRWMFHCHILDHEDHGMMGVLEIT